MAEPTRTEKYFERIRKAVDDGLKRSDATAFTKKLLRELEGEWKRSQTRRDELHRAVSKIEDKVLRLSEKTARTHPSMSNALEKIWDKLRDYRGPKTKEPS